MMRLKVKKIIPILLVIIFIITTFGGCVSRKMIYSDYLEKVYAELKKIPKEVEGYDLVSTEGVSWENREEAMYYWRERLNYWGDQKITIDQEGYTIRCIIDSIGIFKNDGWEVVKGLRIEDCASETMEKIFSIYDNFNHKLEEEGVLEFKGVTFFDGKIFVLVETFANYPLGLPNRSITWWPQLLFEYDFDSNVLKYAGYCNEIEQHHIPHMDNRMDIGVSCIEYHIVKI